MNPIEMSEKEMMEDSLHSQKQMSSSYNLCASECESNQLRATFLNILSEEQELGAQIFEEMSARGWYQTDSASQSDIAKAKQKFVQQKN